MKALKTFKKLDDVGMMDITLDELFDIDGGHLHTTTIKESDGSTTIIYTDSQGNCLGVRNITPSC